jgi:hypothetical protein
MREPLLSRGRLVFLATCLVCLLTFTLSSREEQLLTPRVPLAEDWSLHHMVFSQPANMWQAARAQRDPRYLLQYYRQNIRSLAGSGESARAFGRNLPGLQGLHGDWGVPLVSGATVGAGNYPAKFTFDINAPPSCTADYVAFNTSVSNNLQIVAFNNLYVGQTSGETGGAGCTSTTGPSVMFAYNTRLAGDTTGTTSTSVVLSLDGTEIAYVESNPSFFGGGALLKILRWKAGEGSIAAPAKPTNTTLTAWSACPASTSCLITVPFGDKQPDTISSPFYVFGADVLYVGTSDGLLHKFTGVFFGTPAEDTTNDGAGGAAWPITVNSGHALSSPVYDSGSGNVYVGDSTGRLSFVRTAASTVGTCTPLPCLDATNLAVGTGGSIVDGPIVDSMAQEVFAINGTETSHDGIILQAPTSFASSVTENIGANSGTTGVAMHVGAFDNAYLTSSAPNIAGFLYVCGKQSDTVTPGATDRPAIYRLGFTGAGVMNSVSASFQVGNPSGGACSPMTEFFNSSGTPTDWLFFSVGSNVPAAVIPAGSSCTAGGGCIMSINLTTLTAWPPASGKVSFATIVPNNASAGTSGIILDNAGTGSQESSIYYTYGANATNAAKCDTTTGKGCAVKVTQSGLN